jgi:anthranilate synthase/indole-3-glycerol phosphate synthase/phosphoribosylanthranilate isomerase
LDEIATQRLLDVTIAKTTTPLEPLQQLILQNDAAFGPPLDLYTVFTRTNPDAATPTSPIALAAEFKRASPSKGDIALDVDIATQITTYANAGAALVSVLTEPNWFKGSLQDMQQARSAVEAQFLQATQATHATHASTDPPHPQRVAVLRKDFIVDEYQLYEARAFGADTVLLIVAILDDRNLTSLLNTARALGMEPLVEVNSIEELHRALAATALVIGVNNRNLHTFQVDLGTTERVARALSFVC